MLVTLLLPPALTFVLALALHMFAKEKAERVAVLPVAISLLACWVFIARPGWLPVDDVRRVVHVALGGAILGLVLDALKPHRFITAVLVAIYVLGCAASVIPIDPMTLKAGALVAGLGALGFLILARFDAMHERPASLIILLTLVAFGLAVLSAIGQDAPLAKLALILAAVLAGYLVFVILMGAPVSDGVILVTGTPMLAIVWALVERHPDMRLALLCLPLVLFAETTAQKIPLPAARISALLYPLILGVFVSIPLALAALISFVTSMP